MNDLDAFASALEAGILGADPTFAGFFSSRSPIAIGRAPGRLDVMGGIADYSGSLVLQLPIREATFAAAQVAEEGDGLWIRSLPQRPGEPTRELRIPSDELQRLCQAPYEASRAFFAGDPESHWASYVAGVVIVLAHERGVAPPPGLRILLQSTVPEAKGVSSSAAIEVAAMRAYSSLMGVELSGDELGHLSQRAENYVVGAPCGIMDQMTSSLGREGALLALLCQPAEVQGFVTIPPGIGFWGIDSGIRHAVSGSDYTSVRTGAFMGYRIIAELARLAPHPETPTQVAKFHDPDWGGYLANLGVETFTTRFRHHLPDSIQGQDFLDRYGATTDPVTRVDPARRYAVLVPTAHPVHEHDRVNRFAALLAQQPTDATLAAMGELMYASHESYSACGLGSSGTDRLVALVRESGQAQGLFGAKITGGGSGGTVAILGRADASPEVQRIAERYAAESGHPPYVFAGSSPGAYRTGVRWSFKGGQGADSVGQARSTQ
ncbi:MAG: galactokinase family protein [Isosphaeraceae bacterium]